MVFVPEALVSCSHLREWEVKNTTFLIGISEINM